MSDEELIASLPPAPEPPDDLADRVLARVRARPRFPVADVVAVLALALVVVAGGGRRRWDGVAEVAARTTLAIGPRAVAVAERGSSLRWTVERGARVEQRAGKVFYRVEPGGGPFVVATPAGEARVTGTCFTVEVESMNATTKTLAGGVAGAALATLVTVSVYEGRVILAGPRGQTTVEAGQKGRLDERAAPRLVPDAPATVAQAARAATAPTTTATRPDEVVALRTRVTQLEELLVHTREQLAETARQTGQPLRVSPSAEDLKTWAQKCEVHLDAPSVWNGAPETMTGEMAAAWGLTPDEVPIVDQAQAEAHARALAEVRRIYVLATGDATGAETLAAGAMFGEIEDKADPATIAEARRRMSAERAGLARPPDDVTKRPPAEQALRLAVSLGNDFEGLLAQQLGPARARELRERTNGWPGLRMDMDGCPK